jgi:hypothetical protein
MKKYFIAFFLISQMGFSQNNLLWQGYFHTMRLRMFLSPPPLFFAASENALFKNTTDNQIKPTNTIDGLSGPDNQLPLLQCRFDKTLVGYETDL